MAANATVDSNRMQEPTLDEKDPSFRGITPAQRIDALQYVNRRRSLGLGFLWEWTKIFWISVALFLVLRTFIVEALGKTRGKIYGPDGAAALLGLKPTTLSSKVHRMGLKKLIG